MRRRQGENPDSFVCRQAISLVPRREHRRQSVEHPSSRPKGKCGHVPPAHLHRYSCSSKAASCSSQVEACFHCPQHLSLEADSQVCYTSRHCCRGALLSPLKSHP